MDTFKKVIADTECATLFPGHRWSMLLFVFLATQVLPAAAQAQNGRLTAGWPAFDYDGRPSQADGSFAKTAVAGSQIETVRYAVESRTMTAADGRLQVRLDGKNYKGFPAETSRNRTSQSCSMSSAVPPARRRISFRNPLRLKPAKNTS